MVYFVTLLDIGTGVATSVGCFAAGIFIPHLSGLLLPIPAMVLWGFEWAFLADLCTVLLINVSLSRDNAIAIALAVRGLPRKMRIRVLLVGVTVAVFILVVATFFAVYLLDVRFLRLVSGVLILWIATVSMSQHPVITSAEKARSQAFWRAIWMVIVAGLTMSTDNVLAVAAVADSDLFLIVIGLGLSIPLIVLGCSILPGLMDRWPSIVYLSAGVLGIVGGEMIMTDPFVVNVLQPGSLLCHSVEGVCAVGTLTVGMALRREWRPFLTRHRGLSPVIGTGPAGNAFQGNAQLESVDCSDGMKSGRFRLDKGPSLDANSNKKSSPDRRR